MADQELLYFRPDAANDASDAESTGRQVTIDGEEVEVKRQRVVDPAVLAAVQAIFAALTDGDEASSLAALVVIRDAVVDLASDDDGIARETTLVALNGKDFATQATLATRASETTLAAILAKLTVDSTAKSVDVFKRCLKFEPVAGEEVRAEDITGGDRYHGLAADGMTTSAASWTIVRFYRDASANVTRVRVKASISWDQRSSSGNWS